MRSSHSLDRLETTFDDDRLVADAGLLLPATLAQHLGLRELVDEHLDLGPAAGRANAGDKLLTLVMSALAGGDCIDDANALRAGGTGRVLGHVVKAPSTLGTFLRSFRWGHVRQPPRPGRGARVCRRRCPRGGDGPSDEFGMDHEVEGVQLGGAFRPNIHGMQRDARRVAVVDVASLRKHVWYDGAAQERRVPHRVEHRQSALAPSYRSLRQPVAGDVAGVEKRHDSGYVDVQLDLHRVVVVEGLVPHNKRDATH